MNLSPPNGKLSSQPDDSSQRQFDSPIRKALLPNCTEIEVQAVHLQNSGVSNGQDYGNIFVIKSGKDSTWNNINANQYLSKGAAINIEASHDSGENFESEVNKAESTK